MFWLKKHIGADGKLLLAACDKDLLGQAFFDGEHVLEVPGSYFAQEEVNANELLDLANRAWVVHLVGDGVVALAKEHNVVSSDVVRTVQRVPYAMSIKLESAEE